MTNASSLTRVTHFPPATQRQMAQNRAAVSGTPYEPFFDDRLYIDTTALDALSHGPLPEEHVLRDTPDQLNRLLDPGYLPGETGWFAYPDGTAYVAGLVPMPGVSAAMIQWWMWWHSVEAARYTLWYPHCHVSALAQDRERLQRPGLSHQERYVGQTHDVIEYIGDRLMHALISFVDPAELGLDTSRFAAAGVVAHACARVSLARPRVEALTMIHLYRQTTQGVELRSRFFMGERISVHLGARKVDVGGPLKKLGVGHLMMGADPAYELALHDQVEYTHLAAILPGLYQTFAQSGVAGP